MRKIKPGDVIVITLWNIVLILILALFIHEANAQDTTPTVCKNASIVNRFEFHNLPDGWSDGSVVWWALYEGGSFEDGVLMADAYTDNEDTDLIGTATVGSVDYSFELRGDVQTPACEPENAQMPLVALNSPISDVHTVWTSQVVSTGVVCTVKYLEHANVILVCSGL